MQISRLYTLQALLVAWYVVVSHFPGTLAWPRVGGRWKLAMRQKTPTDTRRQYMVRFGRCALDVDFRGLRNNGRAFVCAHTTVSCVFLFRACRAPIPQPPPQPPITRQHVSPRRDTSRRGFAPAMVLGRTSYGSWSILEHQLDATKRVEQISSPLTSWKKTRKTVGK